MSTAYDRLMKAKVSLAMDQIFFGSILLGLEFVEDTEGKETDGMATDGRHLWYNPDWVDELTQRKLEGVLCHEAMHVALCHTTRRKGRDAADWNIACDYVINAELIAEGFDLPEGGLFDPSFKGMSAEAAFTKLAQERPKKGGQDGQGDKDGKGGGSGQGSGEGEGKANSSGSSSGSGKPTGPCPDPGKCGGVRDAPTDEQSYAEQEAEIAVAVSQAANAARAAGKLPAYLEELADKIKQGRVDWKAELRRFCQANSRDEYSWRRPSKRHLARGFIMPSLSGQGRMGKLAVAIDTSGSVNKHTDEFLAEVLAIAEDMQPEELTIIWCDTRVQKTMRIAVDEGDEIPAKLPRIFGGGTTFQPVFDWLDKQGIVPDALLYLTDLIAGNPRDPGYPVMWASTTDYPHPFGEVLRLKE